MKRFVFIAVMAICGLAASPASAQQVTVQGAGTYGDAGCGLGSMLFGAQPGLVQVLASTTNGTFYSQTFGITSGTSNCGASGAIVQAEDFVKGNRPAMAKDISRGQGETIASLAELGGCKDTRAVGKKLQRSYDRIFPTSTTSDQLVGETVVDILKTDKTLSCTKLNG